MLPRVTAPTHPAFGACALVSQLFLDAGRSTTDVLRSTLEQLAAVGNCADLSEGLERMADSMCCELGSAFYWYTVAWYAILLLSCTVGCGCGILGMKRLPDQLWGEQYYRAVLVEGCDVELAVVEELPLFQSMRSKTERYERELDRLVTRGQVNRVRPSHDKHPHPAAANGSRPEQQTLLGPAEQQPPTAV